MKIKKIRTKTFFDFALYSFAGFGIEILLMVLEQNVYSLSFSQWSTFQHSTHLILTSIIWGIILLLLITSLKNKYDFNIFHFKEKPNIKSLLVILIISIISILITTILWGGFKPLKEFSNNGFIIWLFQNIYYLFESGLILITIICGQKFGELTFKKEIIPWGGIFLALTWGLVHILTQGLFTGIYAVAMAILYGLLFILLKKNTKISYLIIAILFIL